MKTETAQHLVGVAAGSSLLLVTVLYPLEPRTTAARVALACFAIALPLLSAMFLALWNTKTTVEDLGRAKWVVFPSFLVGLAAWAVGTTAFFFTIEAWIGWVFVGALGLAGYVHNALEKKPTAPGT